MAIVFVVAASGCGTPRKYRAIDASQGGVDLGLDLGTQAMDAGSALDHPAPTDASGTDSVIVPDCPPSMHMCPGGCVANNDVLTCGSACTPCETPPDGTATCDGISCGGSCPSGKQLCLGACIDGAAACGSTCPPMQHACGRLCPSVLDVKACGTSCLPCPVPAGASQALCDGTKCDFQCMTGYHNCGARCAADGDASACGSACVVCPTDPNGAAQCVGGSCGVACNAGYHSCGGRCVSNRDVGSCGTTSCTACQLPAGGNVTCDGTACQPSCPTGMGLCAGICSATTTACSGACPAGSHNCSGICASNASVDTCGTGTASCTACPKPVGASAATCDGTTCDFNCASGYHRCASPGRCAADNDPTGCGSNCASCPTDPNGAAACVSGSCGLMCNSGFHVCLGKCVSNKAVATCGPNDNTSCTACKLPSGGGSVTCDGLSCISACPAGNKLCNGACITNASACNGACPSGTHNCSGVCQSDTSTTFCGAGCSSCAPPPSNGTAVCSAGSCGIMCAGGFRNCAGTSSCVAITGGCCTSSDCTAGPANTAGVCGSATTCSYPCDSNSKMCGSACIPKASCCTNSDCTAGPANTSGACNTTTHACSYACAAGFKACTAGGTCIASSGCCVSSDCGAAAVCKIAGTCNPTTGVCAAPTNKGSGVADSGCPTSASSCQAGGCNGLGACLPAPVGTVCGAFTCANLTESQGQYTAVDHHQKVCNGALGAAACQNDANRGCNGSLICADAANCKTGCIGDGDCLSGFYCAGGVCTIRKTFGLACASDHECATRLCFDLGTLSGTPTGSKCVECNGKEQCRQNMPTCDLVFSPGRCSSCDSNMQSCNPDGTNLCQPFDVNEFGLVLCTGGAPNCVANHCVCGTGANAECPLGMICASGVCKIDGRQACVRNDECASGTCTQGTCAPDPSGSLCRGNPFGFESSGGCVGVCATGDLQGATNCQ